MRGGRGDKGRGRERGCIGRGRKGHGGKTEDVCEGKERRGEER